MCGIRLSVCFLCTFMLLFFINWWIRGNKLIKPIQKIHFSCRNIHFRQIFFTICPPYFTYGLSESEVVFDLWPFFQGHFQGYTLILGQLWPVQFFYGNHMLEIDSNVDGNLQYSNSTILCEIRSLGQTVKVIKPKRCLNYNRPYLLF